MATLTISDAIYQRLAERAIEQHTTIELLVERLAQQIIKPKSRLDELIDHEHHAYCEAELAKSDEPIPTLEEVRAITAKFKGSLTAQIIADREDRI